MKTLTQRQAAKELAELIIQGYSNSSRKGSAYPEVDRRGL